MELKKNRLGSYPLTPGFFKCRAGDVSPLVGSSTLLHLPTLLHLNVLGPPSAPQDLRRDLPILLPAAAPTTTCCCRIRSFTGALQGKATQSYFPSHITSSFVVRIPYCSMAYCGYPQQIIVLAGIEADGLTIDGVGRLTFVRPQRLLTEHDPLT